MERYFEEEFTNLNRQLLKMGGFVENSISGAIEALKNLNVLAAEKVIADDKAIDELEIEIKEYSIGLLSRFQPQAGDLRFITNAMEINAELERIADLSVSICERVKELAGKPLLKPLIDIPKLAQAAQKMVRDALNSFVNRDVELAKNVILSNRETNSLRGRVHEELLTSLEKDGSTAPRAIPLILVTRHLERICDHSTNIAEDVIYMVKAEIVKHHPERLEQQPD